MLVVVVLPSLFDTTASCYRDWSCLYWHLLNFKSLVFIQGFFNSIWVEVMRGLNFCELADSVHCILSIRFLMALRNHVDCQRLPEYFTNHIHNIVLGEALKHVINRLFLLSIEQESPSGDLPIHKFELVVERIVGFGETDQHRLLQGVELLFGLVGELLQIRRNELSHGFSNAACIGIRRHNGEDQTNDTSFDIDVSSNQIGELLQGSKLIEKGFLNVSLKQFEDHSQSRIGEAVLVIHHSTRGLYIVGRNH